MFFLIDTVDIARYADDNTPYCRRHYGKKSDSIKHF